MFRTIVVPLDGSESATRALPYASQLAQAGGGHLILVRAALAPPPVTLDGSNWERQQAEAISEAETYLSAIAETISNRVRVRTIALYGRAADEILGAARRFGADGIVMATHGRTGLQHLLLGSVTEAVVAKSPLPVVVVQARPGEQPASSLFPAYSARILVPQDGTVNDSTAVRAAIEVLGLRGTLVLLHVIEPPEEVLRDDRGRVLSYIDQQEVSLRSKARAYLTAVAQHLRERSVPLDVEVEVRMGDPANGITMCALDKTADLIVMATHGRTGIQRALVGSVAGTVIRASATPVMLVRREGGGFSRAEPLVQAM